MCNFETDIGMEELAYFEMVAAILCRPTKDLSMEEIESSGFDKYYVDHTLGFWSQAAGGVTFNACEFRSKGKSIGILIADFVFGQIKDEN